MKTKNTILLSLLSTIVISSSFQVLPAFAQSKQLRPLMEKHSQLLNKEKGEDSKAANQELLGDTNPKARLDAAALEEEQKSQAKEAQAKKVNHKNHLTGKNGLRR